MGKQPIDSPTVLVE